MLETAHRRCNIATMAPTRSKIRQKGQISVPLEVRQAGKCTFEDVRETLFPDGPPKRKTPRELKQGPAKFVKERHARGRY